MLRCFIHLLRFIPLGENDMLLLRPNFPTICSFVSAHCSRCGCFQRDYDVLSAKLRIYAELSPSFSHI